MCCRPGLCVYGGCANGRERGEERCGPGRGGRGALGFGNRRAGLNYTREKRNLPRALLTSSASGPSAHQRVCASAIPAVRFGCSIPRSIVLYGVAARDPGALTLTALMLLLSVLGSCCEVRRQTRCVRDVAAECILQYRGVGAMHHGLRIFSSSWLGGRAFVPRRQRPTCGGSGCAPGEGAARVGSERQAGWLAWSASSLGL